MYRIVVILGLFFASLTTWSQDSLLLGHWTIQQMQINKQLIFDSNDPSALLSSVYRKEFSGKTDITRVDSLKAQKKTRKWNAVMKQTFFEFKPGGEVIAGTMQEGRNDISEFTIVTGHYEVLEDKLLIVLPGKNGAAQTTHFHFYIQDATLFLVQEGWENSYTSFTRTQR